MVKSKQLLTTTSYNNRSDMPVWMRVSAFLSLRSPNTQDTYMGIIREWCQFLGADAGTPKSATLVAAATDMHSIAYKNWLEKRPGEKPRSMRKSSTSREVEIVRHSSFRTKKSGLESTLSNATIAKKFAALRRIYRLLISNGLASENPFDTDRVPAPPKEAGRKRPTEMIDFKLVRKIVSLPSHETTKGLRDSAILAALFGGGLRRSEIVNLRVADVRKTSSGTTYLYLRSTKAKRDATQALPKWAGSIVEKLTQSRKKSRASDSDYLFISYTGQGGTKPINEPISASGVYKLFKHYCRLAGVENYVTPHSARATAITRLLDSGIPHREVQEFSRHSSIQMVELYDKRRIGIDNNPGKELDFD